MELDLEEKHMDGIEERIKSLEAVIFRSMQRQNVRQGDTPIQITNFAGELLTKANNFQGEKEEVGANVEGGNRKNSYLVAKALGMETNTNEVGGFTGKHFYDCNICLNKAKDPVLACCGHLFCWSCLYQLSYAYANAKECPVCLGEVFETDLIPVYGNTSANGSGRFEMKETGSRIPPRPNAARIESIRQQRRSRRGASVNQDMLLFGNLHGLE